MVIEFFGNRMGDKYLDTIFSLIYSIYSTEYNNPYTHN